MAKITTNFSEIKGKVKPMHAVGQPPMIGGFLSLDLSPIGYLQEANIPYARLHDVGGNYGGNCFVDIPNLFRDFDADETDPQNYDFTFTDYLIKGMMEYGVNPIFRLGVTIENYAHIKAYRIFPPKDYQKWARICEHVVRHYNEGWADGFRFGIKYWEIWNEPDNGPKGANQMWLGTNEQFYELYHVAACHLKACFGESIKVGGYGACAPRGIFLEPEKYGVDLSVIKERKPQSEIGRHRLEFLFGFFEYIRAHKSPLEFFSWHSYDNAEKTVEMAKFFRRTMAEYGYQDAESILDEWNGPHAEIEHGTSRSASQAAAMLCALHGTETDMLCFYDARMDGGTYGGFFNSLTCKPYSTYYSFKAFGKLYGMGNEVVCESDTPKLYALAAVGDGKQGMLITNTTDQRQTVETSMDGAAVYIIDGDHHFTLTDWASASFTLEKDQTVYLEK